jgi:hypothetical protein
MPKPYPPNGLQFSKSQLQPRTKDLLKCAAVALKVENAGLEAAFGKRRRTWGTAPIKGVSKSLAYWVFEENLVYTMFKALLKSPKKPRVEWESPYPKDRSKKADLVVRGIKGKPTLVFECKWWNNNHKKTLKALADDVAKLRLWPEAERYLLTFWWSWNGLKEDEESVAKAASKEPGLANLPTWQTWAAWFPIHLIAKDGKHKQEKAYFAMMAFKVELPPGA